MSVSAFGSPGSSNACNRPRSLDDSAAHRHRELQSRVDGRPRQVRLAHLAPREHRLIRAAHLAPRREQQHARRQPVQPVRGRQLRQVEFAPQPHQRRLRDVAAARHRRQEVRLVDHHDVVVAVQHRDVERHRHFVGQIAVQVDVRVRRQHRGRGDHGAVGANHLSGKHFRRGRLRRTGPPAPPAPRRRASRTRAGPSPSRTGSGAGTRLN